MNRWGYKVVDQIIWVKLHNNNIYLSTGYYFMHSFEICLVGYKDDGSARTPQFGSESLRKMQNNVLFGEVRKKSQKPDQLYEIIELMMPGSTKIEIFARNNNLRPGWFSIGNQLGETYEKWLIDFNCNNCSSKILTG